MHQREEASRVLLADGETAGPGESVWVFAPDGSLVEWRVVLVLELPSGLNWRQRHGVVAIDGRGRLAILDPYDCRASREECLRWRMLTLDQERTRLTLALEQSDRDIAALRASMGLL